jgi:FkbM family methyltransferase
MAEKLSTSVARPGIARFLAKPWPEKAKALANRWHAFVRSIPVPARLPFGARWIRRRDNLAVPLFGEGFEKDELAFVERFVQPGMTVLDIGAHHGLYTLLASQRVGPWGKVFSFEPSPRERRALRMHVAINFRRNVSVQGVALGNQEGQTELFVVKDFETGCNSLRPPFSYSQTYSVQVPVMTLDSWLQRERVQDVQLIKLDVEGAELDVLKGAQALLGARPRPVILAEVQDVRTQPWGYQAKEILTHLRDIGYVWFGLLPGGKVAELDLSPGTFNGNFVACPQESVELMRR